MDIFGWLLHPKVIPQVLVHSTDILLSLGPRDQHTGGKLHL